MIIFDLDSTLADCEHRRHFICPIRSNCELLSDGKWYYQNIMLTSEPPQRKRFIPDWKSFNEACDLDKPIQPVIYIMNNLILLDNEIQIWSGRCESVRKKTEIWLSDHLFQNGQYPVLLKMRPIGDYIPDEVLKMRWVDEAIAEGKTIDFVFDDRKKVVRAWRERGIFVFDVNQTGEEF